MVQLKPCSVEECSTFRMARCFAEVADGGRGIFKYLSSTMPLPFVMEREQYVISTQWTVSTPYAVSHSETCRPCISDSQLTSRSRKISSAINRDSSLRGTV